MADQVSTLALKVESGGAISSLQKFGAATTLLGGQVDQLKGKLLMLGSSYLSYRMGKGLLQDAAYGQEALGKFEQVLGRFTKEAKGMVEDLRANFNANTADAMQSISTMADQFHKSGADMRQSLDMTYNLQKLAGDLEAFTNAEGGVAAVSQSLSTGLMGTYMPLKKLGIVLNEDIVKERMAQEKMEGLAFASKRAAQMHARYSLIMEQTAAAHGQVARESDNYNNKVRKFNATLADLRGELGDSIIPIATKAMSMLTSATQWVEGFSPKAKTAIVATGALAGGFVALLPKIMSIVYARKTALATQQMATAATGQETAATAANTTAEGANATASNATAASKNLEASARSRNVAAISAENAALRGQSASNLATTIGHHVPGKGSKRINMASDAMTFMPMGKRTVGRKLGETAAKGALGGTKTMTVLDGVSLGFTRFLNSFKKIGSGFSKTFGFLGKVATKLFGIFGKGAGFIGKLIGSLGRFIPFGGKIMGLIARFGGFTTIFAKFASFLVPFTGWISMAFTAISLFKNAPKLLEGAIDKFGGKLTSFGKKIPDLIIAGIKATGNGLKKIGKWMWDTLVGGLLGIGQVVKRLFGFETAASQEYKLLKEREELERKRQQIIDAEEHQHKAELKILENIRQAKNAQLRAQMQGEASRNSDVTNYFLAQTAREQQEGELNDLQSRLDDSKAKSDSLANEQKVKIDVLELLPQKMQEEIDAVWKKAQKRKDAIPAYLGLPKDKTNIDAQARAEEAKIRAKYDRADRRARLGYVNVTTLQKEGNTAVAEEAKKESTRLLSSGASDEEYVDAMKQFLASKGLDEDKYWTKGFAELKEAQDEAAEASDSLRSELEANTETLGNTIAETYRLKGALKESQKAIAAEEEAMAEYGSELSKGLEEGRLDAALEDAKTHNDRMAALNAKSDHAANKVAESQAANVQVKLQSRTIGRLTKELNNLDVGKALATLQNIRADDEGSPEAVAQYAQAAAALKAAGYEVGNMNYQKGGALALVQSINDQIDSKRDELETLTQSRAKNMQIGGELASRQAAARAAQREIDDANKTKNDADREAQEEQEKRINAHAKLLRTRQEAYDNEMYQRDLTALESSGMGAYDIAAQKYQLVSGKGAADWQASQESLRATKEELDKIVNDIAVIQAKEREGIASDEEVAQRQRLQSRRDELQSDYDSEYDKALSNRWNVEKELFGLQKTMADEEDKQLRDYVTEQGDALKKNLEEQESAAQEEYQKRLSERSEVEKEQRQAVSGAKAIAAGTSEAFQIQSKIYDRGQENLPPEKKIEKHTEKIEKFVEQMKEQMYQYLSGNTAITLSMGY